MKQRPRQKENHLGKGDFLTSKIKLGNLTLTTVTPKSQIHDFESVGEILKHNYFLKLSNRSRREIPVTRVGEVRVLQPEKCSRTVYLQTSLPSYSNTQVSWGTK